MDMDYTVRTEKSFADAVDAVVEQTAAAGFRVLCTHDVSATLAERGFERQRVTLVEICNAKYASQVLAADVKIGLLLPCPIMVYAEDDAVFISTMKPTAVGGFFPEAGIDDVAAAVEGVVVAVIEAAAG